MPGGAGCQAEATGPTRRQGTHHPPPNRLAGETDSTTDEEPCRPRRRGVNGDRRVPHTRRSLNSAQKRSLRSPLTLELPRGNATDRGERGRRQDADRKAVAMPNGLASGERTRSHWCLHNRSTPDDRDDPRFCHNRYKSQTPCHRADRYSRYKRNSASSPLASQRLWQL